MMSCYYTCIHFISLWYKSASELLQAMLTVFICEKSPFLRFKNYIFIVLYTLAHHPVISMISTHYELLLLLMSSSYPQSVQARLFVETISTLKSGTWSSWWVTAISLLNFDAVSSLSYSFVVLGRLFCHRIQYIWIKKHFLNNIRNVCKFF